MSHTRPADIQGGHEANYQRFAAVAGPDECWQWRGPIDRHGYAYSAVRKNGKRTGTGGHRIGFLLHRGPIPAGLVLDHLCRNRWCVNPWHLEVVTNHENTLRQRLTGVCRSGKHAMTPDNIYEQRNGHRRCRECMRAGYRRANAKRRERQG